MELLNTLSDHIKWKIQGCCWHYPRGYMELHGCLDCENLMFQVVLFPRNFKIINNEPFPLHSLWFIWPLCTVHTTEWFELGFITDGKTKTKISCKLITLWVDGCLLGLGF